MWTEEQDKLLIDLWQAGTVGAVIAAQLGKTRSAIMGRINRLRAKGHVLREVVRFTPEEAQKRKQERDAKRYRANRPYAQPYTPVKKQPKVLVSDAVLRALEIPVIPEKPVTADEVPYRDPCEITDLRFFSCRYIVGERPTLYCNKIIHKHSYCEDHFKLCYQVGTNAPLTAKPRPAYRNS